MNNKELIENLARKLEKFNFTEIVVLSEINENEVQNIIAELLVQHIIIKRENIYFYQHKNFNNVLKNQIILEQEPAYNEYLELPEYAKNMVNKYVKIYNLTYNLARKDTENVLKEANIKFAYSTTKQMQQKYQQFGLKGLFPKYGKYRPSLIPDNIYNVFKKYYLTKDKLPLNKSIQYAIDELNNKNKTNYENTYSTRSFITRLKQEFSQNAINIMRETIPGINLVQKSKTEMKLSKKSEMLFSDAAKYYFRKLKQEKKLQKLVNQKTSYKNHILPYFENYKICDITLDTLREFKERKYNDGYSVSSVSHYLLVIKFIIRNVSSEFENFAKRTKKIGEYDFIEMNILTKNTIKKLLHYTKYNYPEAYPIIKLSLLTGAAVPEIFALTWQDVNLENKSIHINKFLYFDKLRKYNNPFNCRNLFLDDEITEILISKNHAENSNEYIFKLNIDDYQQTFFEEKILKAIVKKLKLGKFLHTDFVHNFVNLLLEQKVPITYISKQCGINNQKFIAIYEKLIKQKEKEKYNSLKGIC